MTFGERERLRIGAVMAAKNPLRGAAGLDGVGGGDEGLDIVGET